MAPFVLLCCCFFHDTYAPVLAGFSKSCTWGNASAVRAADLGCRRDAVVWCSHGDISIEQNTTEDGGYFHAKNDAQSVEFRDARCEDGQNLSCHSTRRDSDKSRSVAKRPPSTVAKTNPFRPSAYFRPKYRRNSGTRKRKCTVATAHTSKRLAKPARVSLHAG